VEPVGHEGGGADLPPDPDPVAGDELVAGEADEGGGDHRAEVPDGGRVQQPVDRRPGGDDG